MSGWCTLGLGGHARQGSCRRSQTHAQAVLLDARNVAKHLVCHFHRHATKVRHKVNTVGMTGNITFTALATRASSQGQHRSTMTAPVGSQIREWLEAVWDTVLQLNLVVCRRTRLGADALGHDLWRTFPVTAVVAIFTLASSCIQEQFTTQRTTDHLVELTRYESVAIDNRHLVAALAHGAMATQSRVIRALWDILLGETELQIHGTSRFDSEPAF